MNGTQITVNGITGTITTEERFANRFGGAVVYKRPTYVAVLAHGQYKDVVGNYSSKALLAKFAVADATTFLTKVYPAPAPAAIAAPAAVVVDSEPFDLLAFLGI